MRLAGQAKCGFFPVPPEVVTFMSKFLHRPQDPDSLITILDPCCGKGSALEQFAFLLGIKEENCYAVELDVNRGEETKARLPNAKVVTPADFMGTKMSFGCISVAWVNPPYDDEIGGGRRDEARFLLKVLDSIRRGGILMLALPRKQADQNYDIQRHLMMHYEDIVVRNYPAPHRKFNECVIFARRRKELVSAQSLSWYKEVKDCFRDPGDPDAKTYFVPAVAEVPKTFMKSTYTESELAAVMAKSSLRRVFDPPKPKPQPRPGLQLSAGQRALVLAGGFLNRVLVKDGEPILIKASPYKESYVKEQTEEEVFNARTGDSEMKTTTIVSERICLKVRVLDEKGVIHDVK